MGQAHWPSKLPDGTVLVAVRLAVLAPDALSLVDDCILRWVAEKEAAGVRLQSDLASSPTAEAVDAATIDVVFNGMADSRMWKDWMVNLTQQLSAIGCVRVAGFEDRVSGTFRPFRPTSDPSSVVE